MHLITLAQTENVRGKLMFRVKWSVLNCVEIMIYSVQSWDPTASLPMLKKKKKGLLYQVSDFSPKNRGGLTGQAAILQLK